MVTQLEGHSLRETPHPRDSRGARQGWRRQVAAMDRTSCRRISGGSLAEVMIASGVFLVIAASFITGLISLQRSFASTMSYARNHAAQLRISDYLARDLRQALTFSQSGSGSGIVVSLTLPKY